MEKRYFAYDAMICSKAAFINAKFSKGKTLLSLRMMHMMISCSKSSLYSCEVAVFKVFQRKKGILRMMHGPSVPPQDPTQTPTMANSPFYMTDRSLVEVMKMTVMMTVMMKNSTALKI